MQPDEQEPPGDQQSTPGRLSETRLRIEVGAPGAARSIVARELDGRVAGAVLASAQLLVSELVTNSVRHSGGTSAQVIVLRVELTPTSIRLEVEDPGDANAVVLRPPDVESGGGFGLNLVRALSERWGRERLAGGGACVWAELAPGPWVPAAAPA